MMHTGSYGHWGYHRIAGMILWKLGIVFFLGGLVALWQGGEFWGVSFGTWYWTALVSGVLAVGAKGKRHNCCGDCKSWEEPKK